MTSAVKEFSSKQREKLNYGFKEGKKEKEATGFDDKRAGASGSCQESKIIAR